MKKTIISLAIVSVFASASASATYNAEINDAILATGVESNNHAISANTDKIQVNTDAISSTNNNLNNLAQDVVNNATDNKLLSNKVDANKQEQDMANAQLATGVEGNNQLINENKDQIEANQAEQDTNNAKLKEYLESQKPVSQDMAAYNDGVKEIYAQGQKNAADIQTLFGEVGRLDDRIDASMAMNQATVAARPQLFEGQTSAVGVGVGTANGVQALSVGYSHRINDQWSTNANLATSIGAQDNDFSAGVGASFAW